MRLGRAKMFWVGAAIFGLAISLPLTWVLSQFHFPIEKPFVGASEHILGAGATFAIQEPEGWASPLVILTATLCVITGWLAWYTRGLFRETRRLAADASRSSDKQIAAANKATQQRLRAYPGVTGARIVFESNRLSIRFIVQNFSSTPAYKFRYAINHGVFPPDEPIDISRTLLRDTQWDMAAGAMSKMEDFGKLKAGEYEKLISGALILFVWGRAEYEDAFGEARHIEFLYRCSDIKEELVEGKFVSGGGYRAHIRVCTEPDPIEYASN